MKDVMMWTNIVVAGVAGGVALWRGIQVILWIMGAGGLADPKSYVGLLLVGLAVLTFALLNMKAILDGWPPE